jgi:hypothetical protein
VAKNARISKNSFVRLDSSNFSKKIADLKKLREQVRLAEAASRPAVTAPATLNSRSNALH